MSRAAAPVRTPRRCTFSTVTTLPPSTERECRKAGENAICRSCSRRFPRRVSHDGPPSSPPSRLGKSGSFPADPRQDCCRHTVCVSPVDNIHLVKLRFALELSGSRSAHRRPLESEDMAPRRPEPFQLALGSLRVQLREGTFPPGARITATEVAAALNLSPTPVREALAWMAGAGLVEERRGQGFFIRQLTASDIADLYRLSLAYLLISQGHDRPQLSRRVTEGGVDSAEPVVDPVAAVERLFATWIAAGAGRVLAGAHRIVQAQLGPVRRLEHLVIGNLAEEAQALGSTSDGQGTAERLSRLRHFHARRVRLANRLAALLVGRDGEGPENRVDMV